MLVFRAVATNGTNLGGLKQQRCILSHAQEVGSPKSKYQRGRAPAGTSENPSLPCPTSGGPRHSLAWG